MDISDVNGLRYHVTMMMVMLMDKGIIFLVMLSERQMFGDVNG